MRAIGCFPGWLRLCVLILIVTLFAYPASAQEQATITIAAPILNGGEDGVVEARIDCDGEQCSLFAVTLTFDPARLRVNDLELGLYLGSVNEGLAIVVENNVDNDVGEIRLAATSLGAFRPPQNDVLFRVNVTAFSAGVPHFNVTRLEIGDRSANPVSALMIVETIIEPTLASTRLLTPIPTVITTHVAQVQPTNVTSVQHSVITYARIYTRYGDTLNLRENPFIDAAILEELPVGAVVSVIGGAVDQDGFRWWNLLSPTGVTGWSVEVADGVVTLSFSNDLTPSLIVGRGSIADAPRYRYGQQVWGSVGGDIWTRPNPSHGRVVTHLESSLDLEIAGIIFAGYLLNGTPTWWYLVRVPGEIEARGWMTEYQLMRK